VNDLHGVEKERRLSAYIDTLNRGRTPVAHRMGSADDQDGVRAAVRAVRRLKGPVVPNRSFERRLLRHLGIPVSVSRRQTGMAKVALLALLLTVLAGLTFMVYTATKKGPLEALMERLQALETGTVPADLRSYSGTIKPFQAGECLVFFLPPDKKLIRETESGAVRATNGRVWWCYEPAARTAHLGDTAGSWAGFYRLEGQWPFHTQTFTRANDDSRYEQLVISGTARVLGRKTYVLSLRHGEGFSESRLWVDTVTSLPLRQAEVGSDGTLYSVSEFTAIDFSPSLDPGMFDPAFPEGTLIVHHKTGELQELGQEVDVRLREPASLLAYVYADRAYLSSWVDPDAPGGSAWEIIWFYQPPFRLGTTGTELRVCASNRPMEMPSGTPEAVELAPGVSGSV